ncbi:unnamed protein product [Boreogadus saida]
MAAEELEQINVIAKMSNQVVQEYEALQREHGLTTMECQRIQEERDKAIQKLNEFQQGGFISTPSPPYLTDRQTQKEL